MLVKSVVFLFLLTVLQVSARHNSVKTENENLIENDINSEPVAVSSLASRITSGWVAQPGQHPHHAALRMVNSNGGIMQCGSSIVSQEWVITSAFCVLHRVLAVVRAGVVSLINPEYIFETTEWYSHPKYNTLASGWTVSAYDIALMKLRRPLVYTNLIKPIRIQSSADAYRNYDGQQVYVSGHGRTSSTGSESDVLRWVYLRAITNAVCRRSFANGGGVFDTTICARHFNVTSQNACYGDNGGPLVHVGSDGVPTLIGVSYFFPSRGCESGLPTGYTRPGPFLGWFEEVTGIDFGNQRDDSTVADTTTNTPATTFPTSTNPTPINVTSTIPTSTNPTPINATSTIPTSTDPAPINSSSTIPTSTDPTPIKPTSTILTSTDPAPINHTSTIPTSTDPAPIKPTSTNPTSTETVPINPTSTIPTSTNPAPINPTSSNPITTDSVSINYTSPIPTSTDPAPINPTSTIPTSTNLPPINTTSTSSAPPKPTTTPSDPTSPTFTSPTSTTLSSTDSEDYTTEESSTTQPEDSEEKEEEDEDSDSAESNEDDDIAQLIKRLLVDVKVKVRLNKYNVTKETGLEVNHHRH